HATYDDGKNEADHVLSANTLDQHNKNECRYGCKAQMRPAANCQTEARAGKTQPQRPPGGCCKPAEKEIEPTAYTAIPARNRNLIDFNAVQEEGRRLSDADSKQAKEQEGHRE